MKVKIKEIIENATCKECHAVYGEKEHEAMILEATNKVWKLLEDQRTTEAGKRHLSRVSESMKITSMKNSLRERIGQLKIFEEEYRSEKIYERARDCSIKAHTLTVVLKRLKTDFPNL